MLLHEMLIIILYFVVGYFIFSKMMHYPPIASFLLTYFIIVFCFCHYISNHASLAPPVVSTAPYLTPHDPIPKIIYTYWNSDEKPRTVEKCINSWIKNNPTYKIVVHDFESAKCILPPKILKYSKSNQMTADFLRLELLSQTGGIWLDASVYTPVPIDWVHSAQQTTNCEFVGYEMPKFKSAGIPIVENWMMAAVPDSMFIKKWKKKFFSISNYESPEQYVNSIEKKTCIKNMDLKYYLTMHVACKHIMHKNNYQLCLFDATTGPYLYQCSHFSLFTFPFVFMWFKGKESPLVKYTKSERFFLEHFDMYRFLN